MSDELKQTVRIVRKNKIVTDDRGHSVWNAPVETAELELVSTAMLKTILSSEDEEAKRGVAAAAQGGDGVLAHDADSNQFEIIDEDTLKAALASAAETSPESQPVDVVPEPASNEAHLQAAELSLISTRMLRSILDEENPGESPILVADGIDPYNSR